MLFEYVEGRGGHPTDKLANKASVSSLRTSRNPFGPRAYNNHLISESRESAFEVDTFSLSPTPVTSAPLLNSCQLRLPSLMDVIVERFATTGATMMVEPNNAINKEEFRKNKVLLNLVHSKDETIVMHLKSIEHLSVELQITYLILQFDMPV